MSSYNQSPQDEGYSEDPLSGSTVSIGCPPWFSNMTIRERSEFVMGLMAQLPTSEVADIVRNLRPRLYINFFNHLPPEVCLKILGYLDPDSLMRTAQASREWMGLAFDRRLWEQLYIRDGFRLINAEVESYEMGLNVGEAQPNGQSGGHSNKRRGTPYRKLPLGAGDIDADVMEIDTPMHKQPSIFGPITGTRLAKEPLPDEDTTMTSPKSPSAQAAHSLSHHNTQRRDKGLSNHPMRSGRAISEELSSLVVLDRSTKKKRLNWQYLYSQRRRLEANWESERFTNFQLPHPNYPEEAHEECIYTLQYSGKYLVSGSRDRTLRIWNIDTQRLVRPPLRAHSGSVLCLQFDADPEEDLIVSGSSDATIVIWKFSTGQIIQRFRKAHRESVLNVRFDKRVLVTCSKDKLIRIFNRRPMNPGDMGYPGLPGGVHPVPTTIDYGFNLAPTASLPVLPSYSLIGTLVGHSAAVNAVQIHGSEIVSASGDRYIKVWHWPDQTCTRTLSGHKKGIACVQYDGRRIVSGSSDNEVRVYDKESGLVVATLRAHTNLVRTVQAGFADLPNSAEEDAELARLTDLEYFNAVDSGIVSQDVSLRGRLPNAGSRKPEDITAYGAKVPPGGGGGRFGRIVSGSYDETVIIWRKDREGIWKAQHTLRQEDAAHAAHRHTKKHDSTEQETQLSRSSTPPPQPTNGTSSAGGSEASGSDIWYRHFIDVTFAQGAAALQRALQTHPQLLTRAEFSQKMATLSTADRHLFQAVIATALQEQQNLAQSGNSSGPASSQAVQQNHTISTSSATTNNNTTAAVIATSNSTITNPNSTPAVSTHPILTSATAALPAPAPGAHPPGGANMARVFKLQFDARRIICCSQTTTIVGWDFANGDEKLIEASRFFAPIE